MIKKKGGQVGVSINPFHYYYNEKNEKKDDKKKDNLRTNPTQV